MKRLFPALLTLALAACATPPAKPRESISMTAIPPTYFDRLSGKTEDTIVYLTPHGDIEKGFSMTEVMNVLGNPSRIITGQQNETWIYNFEGRKRIVVYFLRNKVHEVTDTPKPVD